MVLAAPRDPGPPPETRLLHHQNGKKPPLSFTFFLSLECSAIALASCSLRAHPILGEWKEWAHFKGEKSLDFGFNGFEAA
ncbi:hypothetical protein HPP92_010371 [Vanilla planifolia]|uniref:Uncharacterized protein n=1 Tax=Vanilla planifolia TaxID=51239 RepID=A0A835V1R8_VANPL|nr:hypothetical protein HPP92_010371 [Vanilla planifolia]